MRKVVITLAALLIASFLILSPVMAATQSTAKLTSSSTPKPTSKPIKSGCTNAWGDPCVTQCPIQIRILSLPLTANIYVDNQFKGYTDSILLNLPVGTHTLKVTASGYNNYEKSFTSPTDYNRFKQFGDCGAGVFVYVQMTPSTTQKSNTKSSTNQINTATGQNNQKSNTQTGSLKVASDAMPTEVYWDNRYIGNIIAGPGGINTISGITAGQHTVRFVNKGTKIEKTYNIVIKDNSAYISNKKITQLVAYFYGTLGLVKIQEI